MTGREWLGMYGMLVKGLAVFVVILVGFLVLFGFQVSVIGMLAVALGATTPEAWGWSHLAAVPAVFELVVVIVGLGSLEDRGMKGGGVTD